LKQRDKKRRKFCPFFFPWLIPSQNAVPTLQTIFFLPIQYAGMNGAESGVLPD
jgi:hypothetical protein